MGGREKKGEDEKKRMKRGRSDLGGKVRLLGERGCTIFLIYSAKVRTLGSLYQLH